MTQNIVAKTTARTKSTAKPVIKKSNTPTNEAFSISNDDPDNPTLEIIDKKLLGILREYISIDSIWENNPKFSIHDLMIELGGLEHALKHYPKTPGLRQLLNITIESNKKTLETIENQLAKNKISFAGLQLILKKGSEVVIHGTYMQGAQVTNIRIEHTMFGRGLRVEYEYISCNGQDFYVEDDSIYVMSFNGVKDLCNLPLTLITPQQKHDLAIRGQAYQNLALGSHYMNLTAHMDVKKWYYWMSIRAAGRCMIDVATYEQFDNGGRRGKTDNKMKQIADEQLWMTDAYVTGFSFVSKQWGKFGVSSLENIKFREKAYDQLVLEPDKKLLIKSLVEHSNRGFSDVIQGKGGGCIFLLHGEPGVGKTLTAEAVSELLKRPLYSVSVGELGTSTEELEKNLRQILDVAEIWNAVILIDEADIFLEKRGNDIVRNSLTSIFLRLTEYFQGVMFLTTNRVKTFDPAFYSRISIALKYKGLCPSSRKQIWNNLLDAANINGLNTEELSEIELNGRQIKNTIRIAQGLALQSGCSVSKEHIMQIVGISREFLNDLKSE
jgi:hypothetical protein